ncbi:AAA family ATPase [Altererythrobacter arenosus]|uniref:AAA family ATPase n=1 Tax=Altererythrobacter arenosus TaxID=3032592 RepID=A0ABY8FX60_9SPHN|nr:AAA family ATPase [Altererythrobacter sp. CAU 1644]WFL78573.1 AAA family ATPase [Altererythrobacter sp. CAU 1644]
MMSSQPMDLAELALDEAGSRIAAASIKTLDLAALAHVEPTPKQFIVPKFAPAGEVTLFTGPGGAGKSLLAQQLATSVAAGVSTLGLELRQSPALYLTCEDDADELHWRQKHICKMLGVRMESLAEKLHLSSLRGNLNNALGMDGKGDEFELTPAYTRLTEKVRQAGAKFVALDNIAHLFVGNENDRGSVTRFVNALNRLAGETGAAVVLLGHPNKTGDTYSGSTAWLNAVRSQFTLNHDLQTNMRTLTIGKANYAQMGDSIRLAWLDWAFIHEDELPPDTARSIEETARARTEDMAFMRCLAACTERRRNVSHQPGSNYAPKIFAAMTEAQGIKKSAFESAMERLLYRAEIELDVELWKGSNRHFKRGIQATDRNR